MIDVTFQLGLCEETWQFAVWVSVGNFIVMFISCNNAYS